MNRQLRIAAWILGIGLFGYFVVGGLLYRIPVGLDWSAWLGGSAMKSLLGAIGFEGHGAIMGAIWLLGAAVALLWLVARTLGRSQREAGVSAGRRRTVVTLGTLGAAALAGGTGAARALRGLGSDDVGWGPFASVGDAPQTHPEYPDAWKGARVKGYRRLGRTNWQVSDVVVGAGRIGRLVDETKGTEIVRTAIDRGISYVDTSPDYSATGSETAVAAAIEGVRDQIFLATKFCTPFGHLGAGTKVADYKHVIEESLRRLRTDYVDLAHVHACDTTNRLLDENLHEAVDRLREEGKLRFLGFSTHTPNLVQVVEAGIDSGLFDVMMVAYHHGIWPRLPALISRARTEQDMGVVAMKTLKGGKHHGLAGFREEATSFSQAALRWVLSNPDVSAAVISFFEFQHIDEYLQASGSALTRRDLTILDAYDRQIAGSYCSPHCGVCITSCPEDVPIHDVLRHRMYFEDYGDEKEAMRLYAGLPVNAEACAACSAPCAGSCPVGIAIPERTRSAHDLLTLHPDLRS